MPDTITAPSQPAPSAPSDAARSTGPDNVGVTQYARQFLTKPVVAEAPPAEPAPAAEPITTEPSVPAVETPQVPAETPQHEANVETEVEDVLSQSTSQKLPPLPKEYQEVVDKRIAKIRAKAGEAERRADAAEAALVRLAQAGPQSQQQQAPVQAEIPVQPLAKIQTIQELQNLHKQATEAVRFAEYNLDREDLTERQTESGQTVKGVVIEGQFYSKEQLRTIKYNAQLTRETEIPQRAQFLTQQHQAAQQAFDLYPWLKDQSTVEYQTAQTAMREQPWIQNLPNGLLILGRMVEGYKVELAKVKPANVITKPAPRPRPSGDQSVVSSADTGITRAPVGTQARAAIAAEDTKLATKGNVSAAEYAASLTRKRQLRNSS